MNPERTQRGNKAELIRGKTRGPALRPLLAALCFGSLLILPATAMGHGMSEEDRQAMLEGGYRLYGILGAKHMVTGYDHLLFLFGVMFFLTKFGEIVKFITAFTLGHSVTLIFATLLQIKANYFLIDAVIALTVCYKGFDNLNGFRRYLDVKPPNLLLLVFIFGLIHGFGLSARVQTLPLGEGAPFIFRLISFNVGVEAGQVLALTVMLTFLSFWRHTATFRKFSGAANTGLIVAGGLLFLMQVHGYAHTQDPNAFGFARDLHSHVHAEMYEASKTSGEPKAVGLEALGGMGPATESESGQPPDADPGTDNIQQPWTPPAPAEEPGTTEAPATDNPQRPWSPPAE